MTAEKPLTLRELDSLGVEQLRGVGERKRDALAAVDVATVADLLMFYPRRYVDRTNECRVADVVIGEEAMVLATVDKVANRRTRNGRALVEVEISDATGAMRLTFFNQAWRSRQLKVGAHAVFWGKVDTYKGQRQMTNPVVDLVGDKTGRIVPIYPQSEKAGLSTWEVASFVAEALRRARPRGVADPVPQHILKRFGFGERGGALVGIHEPASMGDVVRARDRLVFDELLRVQLVLVKRKRALEASSSGIEHVVDGDLTRRFHDLLPFELTSAQRGAIEEIEADLAAPMPMHRLLQGDVGSGKTLVAVSALLVAVQGGNQGALMAPTEVLAEQHSTTVRELLTGLTVEDPATLEGERPLRVEVLTNRVPAAERRKIEAGLACGDVDVAIGTHALIQEGIEFDSLGVVVVDEQHRFGVEQRAALRDKGRASGSDPDVLVMTATPIPRTAAMTVYGDLDVSVLDEMPPGRIPVKTRWARGPLDEETVWETVRTEVAAGRQAYIVCPLIDESEKLEARSAEEAFAELEAGELAGLSIGLLHGRLKPREKDLTMELFRKGKLQVMVATTVIEVGVDVANATVMVVLSADRFGIAQLHQLRGRVGRGAHQSMCFLLADEVEGPAASRLEALEGSNDGFELAEIDLELRGEGTLFDERQTGRNDLRLASLRRDREWVERAREVAFEIVDAEGDFADYELLAEELAWFVESRGENAEFLFKS